MKRPEDVTRWAEDPGAPAALGEALRAARGPAPDSESLKRIGVALGIAVPVVAVPPAAAAATAAGIGAVKIAITSIAAVGAATAVAVVGFGVGRSPAPAPKRPAPAVVEKVAPRAAEIEPVAPPTEEELPAPAVVAPPPARHHHRARSVVAPVEPVAEDAPASAPEVPADVASRLREEAALVQRAERLLDGDPAGALRLTEERRRRFPTGALDQEAEVVAIDALLRLGRRPEAASRARAFEAAHAGSLHARRIQRLMHD